MEHGAKERSPTRWLDRRNRSLGYLRILGRTDCGHSGTYGRFVRFPAHSPFALVSFIPEGVFFTVLNPLSSPSQGRVPEQILRWFGLRIPTVLVRSDFGDRFQLYGRISVE